MCVDHFLRFITESDAQVEVLDWGPHHWFSRPEITDAQQLLVVRVKMPGGKAHAFHRHPGMEEVLYYIEGRAEQWVGRERRVVRAGEAVFVPRDEVHGTYNIYNEPVTFLAILSPARFEGPALVDVSGDEPWKSLRGGA